MALAYYITERRQLAPSPAEGLEEALTEKVRMAFRAGVDFVQLREKDLPGRRLASLVANLVRQTEKKKTHLLVNERLDVARACGADGVHLPSDSLPLSAVRAWVKKDWIVGISCHNAQEVELAAQGGADYVLLGPVFSTPSKPDAVPLGLLTLSEVCRRSPVPVFALGGVNLSNARHCVRVGAAGVAGIRLFQQAASLDEVCRQLRSL